MKIRNARDLGLLLRQKRRSRGWSQADLADRIGASRHWVIEVERGKPTAELGLVLKAISALDLTLDVRESGAAGFIRPCSGASVSYEAPAPSVDLAGVLSSARGHRLAPPGPQSPVTQTGVRESRKITSENIRKASESPVVTFAAGIPIPDLKQVLVRMSGSNNAREGTSFQPAQTGMETNSKKLGRP